MRALSLFAGYGGLTLAIEEVFGAELVAYSEFDAAPSAVMEHHWPGVPNLGDITQIDWAAVNREYGPIDLIDGGSPCQDLSAAGRRAGMTEGTRSNLWVNMREAIAQLKPKYVVWENVRGAYSAVASSEEDKHAADCWLEQCQGCVGDGSSRPALRALGRVLGDLSDLGYDCQWSGLRAADVGAAHGRFRVFVLATRRETPSHPGHDSGRRECADSRQAGAAGPREAGARCDWYADEVVSIWRDFPDGPEQVYGVRGEQSIRAAAESEYRVGGPLDYEHVLEPYDAAANPTR